MRGDASILIRADTGDARSAATVQHATLHNPMLATPTRRGGSFGRSRMCPPVLPKAQPEESPRQSVG